MHPPYGLVTHKNLFSVCDFISPFLPWLLARSAERLCGVSRAVAGPALTGWVTRGGRCTAGGHQAVTLCATYHCPAVLQGAGGSEGGSEKGSLILSLGTLEDVDVVREVQDVPTTHMVWKPRAFHPPWLWFGPRGKRDHSSRSVITFKSSQQPLWPGACPGE